jgi:L-ascorbate metabolism protein UlaG (beta-lactamase superfamily)
VIAPDRLTAIEVVTATHHHTDHLDAATLAALFAANPGMRLVCPAAWRDLAGERSGEPRARLVALDAGDTCVLGVWNVAAIPAAHETLEYDAQGRCRALGYVVGFGSWTVYHAGDTVRYDGHAERLKNLRVDVALLPINGRSAERGVPGNLTGEEAAALARDAAVRLAVPCHYDMFASNTASPEGFVREAARLGQPVRVLRQGEALTAADLDAAGVPGR